MFLSERTSRALDILVGGFFNLNRTTDRMVSVMQNKWSMPVAADIVHHNLAHIWPLMADIVSGFKDEYNLTTVYPETHKDDRGYDNLYDMMDVMLREVGSMYDMIKQAYDIAVEEHDFNAMVMLQGLMEKMTKLIGQVITLRDKAEQMPEGYDTYDFHIKDWGIVGVELA